MLYSQDVKKSIEDAGLNISLHDGYSIITLNSTVTVKDDQVPKKIMLVEMVEGGMWKTCYVTNGKLKMTFYITLKRGKQLLFMLRNKFVGD